MLKLSVSAIGTYEKCPKNYHYRYIEKPEIEKVSWGFLEFGSCAHAVLENFHKHIIEHGISDGYKNIMKLSFESAVKDFDMKILRSPVWTPDGEKSGIKYLKEIMREYLSIIIDDGLPDVVGVEVPFDRDIGGYRVRGYIDRIDRVESGHYRVVDYKTSKSPKYLDSFQLAVYSLVVKDMFDDYDKISGSYSLLKHKFKTMDWEFSEDDLNRTKEKIATVGGYIENEERWIKKPSTLCNWCDYKSICQPDSWI